MTPEQLEAKAKDMPCACGVQKAGHSQQKVLDGVREHVHDDPATMTRRRNFACTMECQVCKHQHLFRDGVKETIR